MSLRVIIAEDSVLLRAGITRWLIEAGFEVVAAVEDGELLLRAVAEHQPDVCVVDVRMPPTHTDEGVRAALVIRSTWPDVGVLVLSQYVEERYASELLAGSTRGVGYLLKDRVADVDEFLVALKRVAAADPQASRWPARAADRPRARGARADGGGSLQRRHRRSDGGVGGCRREAREQHLRQARPDARGHRPPSGPRRPALPGGLRW